MDVFKGFAEGKTPHTPIPESFFTELLPLIDGLDELRLALYILWRVDHMEGAFRYIRYEEILQDNSLMQAFGGSSEQGQARLETALEKLERHGMLLKANINTPGKRHTLFFLNSPKGRAAVRAIANGRWRASQGDSPTFQINPQPPNVFQLYEENIGPLTPLLADTLGEAEDTYPADWIEDAIRIAVERNKRNWRYIEAILQRWQREGRDAREEKFKDRRDDQEGPDRFLQGKYSDFIEH
jgi:DnaD/phage-associated family protein